MRALYSNRTTLMFLQLSFSGHMMKGLRQMRKALIETDCVIEVHDARIPLSGRNIDFQHDITGNVILLLSFPKRC